MRQCILSVVIMCVLAQSCASASEAKVEDNFLTTYPVEISSEVPIGPRHLHYDEITAVDQPDHYPKNQGHIKFEDHSPSSPISFKEDNEENQYIIDHNTGVNSNSKKVSFEDDQSDRILTPSVRFEGEGSDQKVNFEGPAPPPLVLGNNDYTELSNDKGKVTHDVDEQFYDHDTDLEDIQDEQALDLKNEKSKSDENIAPKRITFEDDGKKETLDPVPSKKRKPRRKPKVRPLLDDTASATQNAPYPAYPGNGYPGSVYLGPPGTNPSYPRYPHVYPTPGYPGYPVYPTPYPTPYPTAPYAGYSPYPVYPGHGPYPTYPSPTDLRLQTNSAQNEQITQTDIKYPTHEHPGSSVGQRGPGRPGTYPGQEYAGAGYTGAHIQYGYPGYNGYGHSDPTGQYTQYRPPTREKSLTQRAISAVAEALTSIALFDDKQCVPRLLCEVASGGTASSATLLKATAGLQPLLTVLKSYNGVSTSPLFLFGRAAVLGMTTKGNPTSCRYAYPQCPNDPEGLLNYLNNHNGGFFRFFGQPEKPNQQQNLEQFYNHLSGQYGNKQPQKQQQQNQQPGQQQQQYHTYPYGYAAQYSPDNTQNYGPGYYREQNAFRNTKDMDSEVAPSYIEERIQNKPGIDALEDDDQEKTSKWTFPDVAGHKKREERPKRGRKQRAKRPKGYERPVRTDRGGSSLKFPDDRGPLEDRPEFNREGEYIRQQKGIFFPNDNHFNFQTTYQTATSVNLEEYVFDYKHNFYVKRPKAIVKDDSETLYIVRGNGDPNHPEIVKVKPGERI